MKDDNPMKTPTREPLLARASGAWVFFGNDNQYDAVVNHVSRNGETEAEELIAARLALAWNLLDDAAALAKRVAGLKDDLAYEGFPPLDGLVDLARALLAKLENETEAT